jgi:hypothetical protein
MGDGFDCSIRFSQLAMETGTEDVWSTISTALVRHPDNDLVLGFLLERVESSQHNLTNYYQSLELLGDSWATSILRRKYAFYRSRSRDGSSESMPEGEWIGYLLCCRTLSKLAANTEFEDSIKNALSHSSPAVRSFAAMLLKK